MAEQFIREEMLLGAGTAERLQDCHVAVFGIGGVGSYCAEALARAGVGQLTLVDDDTVSVSNLNRQLVALHSTVGMPKVQVMAQRVRDINPNCIVHIRYERYTPENRADFFSQSYHYIADAIDSVACKVDLIETAHSNNIPMISAMGTGNKLDPTKFQITDLSKTSGCPLARVMRRELRAKNILHHTVLYSTELAITPQFIPENEEKRSVPGSVAWVPSCAGLMMAGHIILELLKAE